MKTDSTDIKSALKVCNKYLRWWLKNLWKYSSMHLKKVYWMVPATLSKTLMKDSSSDFIKNIVDIKKNWEMCIGSFHWLYWWWL